jgi:hypothetical protein
MMRLLRCAMPVLCAGLLSLPAAGQTAPATSQTPAATPGAPAAPRAPYVPKNLKVLPDNTDLHKVMRQYAGDLGVECEFCHFTPPGAKRPDFPSDANPMKDKARYMIQMTGDLNTKYLAALPNRKYSDPITCGTCHRGQSHPSVFVAPPRQEGNRPPATPPVTPQPATPPTR